MSEVTEILCSMDRRDPHAAEQLLPLVYEELRRLAAQNIFHEHPGQTLQATALVHEAYLRLVDTEKAQHWNSRGHFFSAAAEAMRRILVERARRKRSQRHGGTRHRCELSENDRIALPLNEELIDLDEALTKLSVEDPQAAEVAKLRMFVGMTVEEVAATQAVSPRTVKRNWAYARAWMARELKGYS
jgi:RNA polymerase sigma factor (TIGR02999 family)